MKKDTIGAILFAIMLPTACMCLSLTIHLSLRKEQKVYQDACHMSDLIRCYRDHLHTDSLIEDYGLFDELENEFLHQDGEVDLSKYSFCY